MWVTILIFFFSAVLQKHTRHAFSELSLYLKTHFGRLCISHTPYWQPWEGAGDNNAKKNCDLPAMTLPTFHCSHSWGRRNCGLDSVLNLFGSRGWFRGRQFFLQNRVEEGCFGDDSSALYLLCTLYLLLLHQIITSDHQALDPRGWGTLESHVGAVTEIFDSINKLDKISIY